jgi:hypothetical protein
MPGGLGQTVAAGACHGQRDRAGQPDPMADRDEHRLGPDPAAQRGTDDLVAVPQGRGCAAALLRIGEAADQA